MNCLKKYLRMSSSLKNKMYLLEKLKKLQVKKEGMFLLILIVKMKKIRNYLKSKEGKLGRQHDCKRSQETLRIIQIGWVDFKFLFDKGQHMVLLIDKFDKCSLVYLDPCGHMGKVWTLQFSTYLLS